MRESGLVIERQEIKEILEKFRTIAVVGMKPAAGESAYDIPMRMRSVGYTIIPVNPKYEIIGGMRSYRNLGELPGPVEIIDVFRAIPYIRGLAEEVLALPWKPKVFWMQQGIYDDSAAEMLADQGILVVQDRCLALEYGIAGLSNIK